MSAYPVFDEVLLGVRRQHWCGRRPTSDRGRVLVSYHVHLVLHGHRQPQELVIEGGGAEKPHPLGVWHLEVGDGALGGHLESIVVEPFEGNGIEVVHIFREI